jgi:IPT/TIG domain-containing protein
MRMMIVVSLLLAGLAAALPAQVPQMNSVTPDSGKVGATVRVHGVALGRDKVEGVYLSDHTLDMLVKVLSQSDSLIEFRIPPSVKPGKLQLVIKTAGKEAFLLEQPFYVTVQEPKESGEVAASSK